MAIRDIGPWLLSNSAFSEQLERLTASAVADDLGSAFAKNEDLASFNPDWGYLLLCGSFLAVSDAEGCQAGALRIAQSTLTSATTPPERRDSAALLLDTLANHPALDLAVARQLLKPSLRERLPVAVRIEWLRRSILDTVRAGARDLRVNRFQKKFWEAVQNYDCVSVSAPTSAGKSYIVSEWVADTLGSRSPATVVYIVPTRALISQVERDMRLAFGRSSVQSWDVISTPVRAYIRDGVSTVLVLTQERLQILLAADPHFRVDVLIVDEAHKIGDRTRGVLLQRVMEDVIVSNPTAKLIWISPASSNPDVLIEDVQAGRSVTSLVSDDVTVSQNLIWTTQLPQKPKEWKAQLCLPDRLVELGTFSLTATPIPPSKRLPFVAAAIGQTGPGNVIYVNGAADAEKAATQLYDLFEDIPASPEIDSLIELSAQIVHPEFLLPKVLRRGIAFHYGNLPLILREEIEKLFSLGVIRYLVCTSTLVEGVNMSCRNMFIRGPRRGRSHPMTQEDFWNLAGRAGRWGKEFQGNIVCVDAADTSIWGDSGAPRSKAKYQIERATDSSIKDTDGLITYIEGGAPAETKGSQTRFEATFSYLCNLQQRYGSLMEGPWGRRHSAASLTRIDAAVSAARARLTISPEVIERNPGISPFAMSALLDEIRQRSGALEELIPSEPASEDAVESYVRIFARCARTIAPNIGPSPKRHFILALLVAQWMRGYALSRLIAGRIDAVRRNDADVNVAAMIRAVMEDVEQVARFEAPRFLACYRDILRAVLEERGHHDLVASYPDLSVYLEFGVAAKTQISLITLGLSRTSTIAVSELIAADELTKEDARKWLADNARLWGESDLPRLVKREITAVLDAATTSSAVQ